MTTHKSHFLAALLFEGIPEGSGPTGGNEMRRGCGFDSLLSLNFHKKHTFLFLDVNGSVYLASRYIG